MTRAVWVGQARVWVGHGLPGIIAIEPPMLLMRHKYRYGVTAQCVFRRF